MGDVLDDDTTEVIIIHGDPRTPPRRDQPFKNVLDIGMHSVGILLNEIFITDVREFIRINKNVQEAGAKGVTLHNEKGKEYKYYDYKIIEPDEYLGDIMDFSKPAVKRFMEAGWEKAKEVLG